MGATLQELQASRDHLFERRISGVRQWRDQNGEQVIYATDREMADALAALDREIALATYGQQPKTILFSTSKG